MKGTVQSVVVNSCVARREASGVGDDCWHVGRIVWRRVFSFAEEGHGDYHEVERETEQVIRELSDSFGAKDEEEAEDGAVTNATPNVDEQTPQHRQKRQSAGDDVDQQEGQGNLNLVWVASQNANVGPKCYNIIQKISAHYVCVA